MLKHRIIPVLLVKDGKLVKGQKFDSWRSVGHPLQAARIHEMRGVDELIVLDIGATPNGTTIDPDLVRELTAGCFMPLTVGGGVRTVEDIGGLLRAGADKVATSSRWIPFVRDAVKKYGSQCLVYIQNVRDGDSPPPESQAFHAQQLGFGEILLNSIDRDGTMSGYDLDLIRRVSSNVGIPVIACGGACSPEDCAAAVEAGASAVAVGAMFQFTPVTPHVVAEHFVSRGIPVRI